MPKESAITAQNLDFITNIDLKVFASYIKTLRSMSIFLRFSAIYYFYMQTTVELTAQTTVCIHLNCNITSITLKGSLSAIWTEIHCIPVSTGILPHSLPEWAFRARPGLWRICL